MMKIGIIGYDLFGTGGTKRSNINLINEFIREQYSVTYYNLLPFTSRNAKKVRKEFTNNEKVKFEELKNFQNSVQCDLYIITRESLFTFSSAIKEMYSNSIVVGEVHTPLQLLDPELDFSINFIDYYRVATKEVLNQLKKDIPEEKLFQFPVSVNHLSFAKDKLQLCGNKKNFLIYSRFDEQQKDIAYAIKLMDFFVHYKKNSSYFLYINGNGAYEKAYEQLISLYQLEDYVFINCQIPDDTIYLSTARYETLGYSILEAFNLGKPVILYKGDDNSLVDIYGNLSSICWLTKDISKDAESIDTYFKTDFQTLQKLYKQDLLKIKQIIQKESYVKNYLENLKNKPQKINVILENTINETLKSINKQNNVQENSLILSIYLRLKEVPFLDTLMKSNKIKNLAKKILFKNNQIKNDDILLEGNLKNDFVFIESFHGKSFAGDPKYLALFLKKNYPNLHFYVSSINEMVDIEILKFGMTPIRLGGNRYVDKFRKSKWIIMNGNSLDKSGKVNGQIFIETWHGFPLKKMVADLENLEDRKKETQNFIPRMKKWDYLLASSEKNLELFNSAFNLKENKNLKKLVLGSPRNAYIISNRENIIEQEKIFWKYFNKPYNVSDKIILYCPTWRKNRRKTVSNLDLKKIIQELPDNYKIIVKLHPLETDLISSYNELDERIFAFPNEFSDIQELFLISNVLITDYSSAMFDFAHMDKNIIVLQEDTREYKEKIGWYFDLYEQIGLMGKNYTESELVDSILEVADNSYNKKIVEKFLNKDDKNTNHDIIKYLKNELKEEK